MNKIINAVEIPNNHNTRHFGGYRTMDGRTVIKEKLIRSGMAAGLKEDAQILLNDYNLKRVIDLRTKDEIASNPSIGNLPGVEYIITDLLKKVGSDVEKSKMDALGGRGRDTHILIQAFYALGGTVEGVIEYFSQVYLRIIKDTYCQDLVRQIFNVLLSNDDGGCTFYHCAGGKDRTGVVSALILSALGVSWDKCMEDYLLTNDFMAKANDALMEVIKAETDNPEVLKGIRLVIGVDAVYMDRVYNLINTEYGSMDSYLSEVLLLNEDKINRLKALYTQ